jgi:hypothetical protein
MTWRFLSAFGKSRLLNLSFVWLIVVPLLAKSLAAAKSASILDASLLNILELPFSWKMFYASAVLASVAAVIYWAFCPQIVREYGGFRDFEADGRGAAFLSTYLENHRLWRIVTSRNQALLERVAPTPELADAFWEIYDHEQRSRLFRMVACFLLYASAILLVGYVLPENLLFVIRAA